MIDTVYVQPDADPPHWNTPAHAPLLRLPGRSTSTTDSRPEELRKVWDREEENPFFSLEEGKTLKPLNLDNRFIRRPQHFCPGQVFLSTATTTTTQLWFSEPRQEKQKKRRWCLSLCKCCSTYFSWFLNQVPERRAHFPSHSPFWKRSLDRRKTTFLWRSQNPVDDCFQLTNWQTVTWTV